MNILYTIFSFKTGGTEKLLIDILNNMNLNKHDNLYLCIINDLYDEKLLKLINPSVKIILLNRNTHSKNKFSYVLKYTKIIINNEINVIHCSGISEVKISILAKVLKPQIKIFHTVNSTKTYLNFKKYEVLIDNIFIKKIISISSSVEKDILSRGINKNKIKIIYNAIDIEKFNIVKKQHNDINVGCTARIVPEIKGQDLLIRAIGIIKNTYPDIKCYFAGEPPENKEEYLYYLKDIVKETKTENNIFFIGNISDIPSFLSNIDIFVLPSRNEGFGISLVEAMAAGIPCIASNLDGPKEIIKDKYGLLFESDNYQDLASKILYCILNMKNYDKDKVENYVKENYDIKNMTKKLYDLYK